MWAWCLRVMRGEGVLKVSTAFFRFENLDFLGLKFCQICFFSLDNEISGRYRQASVLDTKKDKVSFGVKC